MTGGRNYTPSLPGRKPDRSMTLEQYHRQASAKGNSSQFDTSNCNAGYGYGFPRDTEELCELDGSKLDKTYFLNCV